MFHQYNWDPKKKRRVKRPRKGLEAEGFGFKGTAVEGWVDRTARRFGIGMADAITIQKVATFAGDEPYSEGETAHALTYKQGERLKAITKLFRGILMEEASGMQSRWESVFGQIGPTLEGKGKGAAPRELEMHRGYAPDGTPREIPKTGWEEPLPKRKKYDAPGQYYEPMFDITDPDAWGDQVPQRPELE